MRDSFNDVRMVLCKQLPPDFIGFTNYFVNHILSMKYPIQSNILNKYTFTLSPEQFFKLASAITPKASANIPYVRKIKSDTELESKVMKFYGWSSNELRKNKSLALSNPHLKPILPKLGLSLKKLKDLGINIPKPKKGGLKKHNWW